MKKLTIAVLLLACFPLVACSDDVRSTSTSSASSDSPFGYRWAVEGSPGGVAFYDHTKPLFVGANVQLWVHDFSRDEPVLNQVDSLSPQVASAELDGEGNLWITGKGVGTTTLRIEGERNGESFVATPTISVEEPDVVLEVNAACTSEREFACVSPGQCSLSYELHWMIEPLIGADWSLLHVEEPNPIDELVFVDRDVSTFASQPPFKSSGGDFLFAIDTGQSEVVRIEGSNGELDLHVVTAAEIDGIRIDGSTAIAAGSTEEVVLRMTKGGVDVCEARIIDWGIESKTPEVCTVEATSASTRRAGDADSAARSAAVAGHQPGDCEVAIDYELRSEDSEKVQFEWTQLLRVQ